MTYEIILSSSSNKFLNSLPGKTALRIIKKLEQVKENPFRYIEHYEGKYHKLRIGDFRLLLDMDIKSKTILIEVFDKRSRIYKK